MKEDEKPFEIPKFDTEAFVSNIDELMKKKMEADRKIREDLVSQTWPTWLFPENFDGWVQLENWCRDQEGKMRFPQIPPEVIAQVIENGRSRYL
jgi:hypothetical protein